MKDMMRISGVSLLLACGGAQDESEVDTDQVRIVSVELYPGERYKIFVRSKEQTFGRPDGVQKECFVYFVIHHFVDEVLGSLQVFQAGSSWMSRIPRTNCLETVVNDPSTVEPDVTINSILSIELIQVKDSYNVVARSNNNRCFGFMKSDSSIPARLALLGMLATANCAVRLDSTADDTLRVPVGVWTYGMFLGFGIDAEYFGPESASSAAASLAVHAMPAYRWWTIRQIDP